MAALPLLILRPTSRGMADALRPPATLLSLQVPRAAPVGGKPTRVSAPLELASFARTRDGCLHFPGTEFLRTFRRRDPPFDLTEGQEDFVDKDEDSGSSIDPILQALRRHAECSSVHKRHRHVMRLNFVPTFHC